MPRRRGDTGIGGNEWHVEPFRESNVRRVIRAQVMAQFPDAIEKIQVLMPGRDQQRKVPKSLPRSLVSNGSRADKSPKRVGRLQVDQMGSMHVGRESNPIPEVASLVSGRSEGNGYQGGGIENDQ
jgi:hypothetical protein